MTENDDLAAERDRLRAEVARLRVAKESAVPVEFLSEAQTEEQARSIAQSALAWRGETPSAPTPPATTAAASYYVGQISRSTLQYLSPDQITEAYRQGRLEEIGAPSPLTQRHNGSH
jgi:hypothetical protein